MRSLLGLMLIGLLLAGCQTTRGTLETRVSCQSYRLIKLSRLDTQGTKDQVKEHNAVYRGMCGE